MKIIIIIISLLALLLVLSFIPVDNQKQVVIKASLYDVAKQINDLDNWKKWNTDFINKNIKVKGGFNSDQFANITLNYTYSLHHVSPLTVSLNRIKKNLPTSSLIEITSVTDTTIAVSWSEKITFFELVKRSTIGHYSRQNNLDNLKKLMEDANNKYGFFIKLVPVKDTLILTAEAALNNSLNVESVLYQQLQTFIIKNNLPAGKKSYYKTILTNNKIAIGIPVYKRINNNNDVKFLELPSNGRLVEGIYSGAYSERYKINYAINNFILDKHLKQVAQPLEQYNVTDTIIKPNNNINLKIYYPVF